jgi:hypothetical protein
MLEPLRAFSLGHTGVQTRPFSRQCSQHRERGRGSSASAEVIAGGVVVERRASLNVLASPTLEKYEMSR